VILSPRNFDVDHVNQNILERLPGDLKEYQSSDSAFQDGAIPDHSIPPEYLNTITLPGMPLHQTAVKVGCPIMLLRNLDPSSRLCNGTRMIVTRTADRVIEAKILTGSHGGQTVFIPRISLDANPSSTNLPFTLRRRQFPIRIAFAMTINKSQGQSLQVVGLRLHEPVFAHGQLYVALSRCTDCRNLYISLRKSNVERTVDNIVYHHVLRM
jgi:ATP-dependent exoDNAse (exonuclease V) alpha subunit